MPEADVIDKPVDTGAPAPKADPAPAPKADVKVDPAPKADLAPKADPAPKADMDAAGWRKVFAGDDPKRLKQLERYNSETDFASAFFEKDRIISEGGRVKPPSDKSTPEEIAAFNKAIGVPEKADGYKITVKPPEGVELGDLDKKMLAGVVTKLHATGATNAQINAAHQFYYDAMEEAEAAKHATAEAKKSETEQLLKGMWGRDFDLNIQLADAFVAEKFGKSAAQIMQLQFMDGTRLGDHPEFLQAFATAGRERAEDPTFLASLNQSGGAPQNLEARKTAIMAKRYGTEAEKREYAQLAADGGELDKINAKLALKK